MFFRDTNKYSIVWTVISLFGLVTLINVQHILPCPTDSNLIIMRSINFLINSFIPTILIITFNAILHKRLKSLLDSHSSAFGGNARNTTLQKAVFSTKITLSISLVFLFCQVLEWVQIVMVLIRHTIHTKLSNCTNCAMHTFF